MTNVNFLVKPIAEAGVSVDSTAPWLAAVGIQGSLSSEGTMPCPLLSRAVLKMEAFCHTMRL